MRGIKNCLLIFFLIFGQATLCFISSAERWEFKKKERPPVCANLQTVYLLSDIHQNHTIDNKQRKELLHFLRTKQATISFIAEDPNTFNNRKLSWEQMRQYVTRSTPLLRNTASLAHHSNILSTSVEFRPDTSIFNSHVSIKDIINTTEEQVKCTAQYDDGPLLNEAYKSYVTRYYSEIVPSVAQLFKNIANQQCDISKIDYTRLECPQETSILMDLYESTSDVDSTDPKQYVEDLITRYAQEAIDIKILHALAEHAKKGSETVVIYAGGAHFDSVKIVLAKLGFALFKYGHAHLKENDINSPLKLSQVFQELDPSYNPNAPLPKETIDYFFEYKKLEEENPSLKNRARMKLFVAAADAVYRYRKWKKEHYTLHKATQASIGVTLLALLCYVITACCK